MNTSEIIFKKFNKEDKEEFSQLVGCYQDVFSDPPWNEFKKCRVCGNYWGRCNQIPEFCCGLPVVDYWSDLEILAKIGSRELTSNNIALNCGSIVGFSVGFATTPEELEEELKLGGLAKIIQGITNGNPRVSYQTDIGVRSKFRRRGIATQLHEIRLADFINMGMILTTLRTKPEAVTYKWYIRYGFEVVAEYPPSDGRVILAKKI